MPELESFLKVPGLAALISFVIGFGIAAMFRPLCKGPDCLIIRGPPVSDIRNSVYQFGTKCVEFVAKAIPCPSAGEKKEVVETMVFADFN
jgi:hypothetical protein